MRFLSMVLHISLCGTFSQKERILLFSKPIQLNLTDPKCVFFPSFCRVGTEAAHKGEQNLKLVCLTKRTSQKDHDIHNRKRKKAEDYALFVVPREDSHHISPKQLNVSPKSCKSFKLHVLPLSESSSTEGVPQFSYHELSLSHRVGSFKYWFLCLICFLFSS